MLQQFKDHRQNIDPPEHISLTADLIWSRHNMHKEFLRTNCEFTVYAIRDYLTPGRANDGDVWVSTTLLPDPQPKIFQVEFDDDHYMIIHDGQVYQSFAFVTELMSTQYNPQDPFWKYVPANKNYFKNIDTYFYILKY